MNQAARRALDVTVREVGLRDGLQNVSTFFPTAAKQQWLRAEAAAGMPEIEAYNRMVPSSDRLEGVRAFNEKRKPDFTGR